MLVMTRPAITLIAAVAENGVIGAGGALPWHIPADLKRFKALTLGKPCIMGRKTWDSLPQKPLRDRVNIVVTRDPSFRADGAVVVHGLAAALDCAACGQPEEIMVIGGGEIFSGALPLASRIHLTVVSAAPPGDAFMPPIDRNAWRETAREGPYEDAEAPYCFVTLERR